MLIDCINEDYKVRFGYDFRDGPIEVEGYMVEKMINHPDFVEVTGEAPKNRGKDTDKEEIKKQKDELEKYAKEMHGVDLDKRLGLDKLIAQVEKLDSDEN